MLPLAFLLFSATGCVELFLKTIAKAPPYPHRPPQELRREAAAMSDALTRHIRAWHRGDAPRAIPRRLIPPGVDFADNKDFHLLHYDEIAPEKQWAVRKAGPIDLNGVQGGLPDPNVTYLVLGTSLVPFGSKLVIEGEFPHCRFFSIQVSPPFDGRSYCIDRTFGPGEVSLVDADIEPLPGHSNPFRPGADRSARKRSYRVSFDMAIGDPLTLNPTFKPPYRGKGTHRVGGLIQYQGPWGPKLGEGMWNMGLVWIRYYAPDTAKGPMAGVPLPKAYCILPTGEKYFLHSDFSGFVARANKRVPAPSTPPREPMPGFGPDVGWGKPFGILLSIAQGVFQAHNLTTPKNLEYVRKIDLGATGRGEDQPPPNNYEINATCCNHNTYLGRSMSLGKDKVLVMTGKLPRFPDTRGGAKRMMRAQLRYWSIVGYDYDMNHDSLCCAINAVMDDELELDHDRRYIIAYSRDHDRPANATRRNGVTWVNWGPLAELGFMLRWQSVEPEWWMPRNLHENTLTWANASFTGSNYNPELIGYNDHCGFLKEYLPKLHYMSVAEFEALGKNLSMDDIPAWIEPHGNGLTEPARSVKRRTKPGLRYEYYEQFVGKVGDIKGRPTEVGVAKQVDRAPVKRNDGVALIFDGYIQVPADGLYSFYLGSDDGSVLWIANRTVIDNDKVHAFTARSGRIELEKGLYPFRLKYFDWFGDAGLLLEWRGPGFGRQTIPVAVLSHR